MRFSSQSGTKFGFLQCLDMSQADTYYHSKICNKMTNFTVLRQKYYAIHLTLVTLCLSACSDPGLADLKDYVANVKAKTHPPIEQIPPYEHIPPHYYEVQDLRDPFIPLVAKIGPSGKATRGTGRRQGSKIKKCPNPNPNRVRTGLELVPLDALKMVGWLEEEGKLMALVMLKSDGTIHYINQHDFVGEHYGQVISLSTRQIEILEQIPDGKGCWKPEVIVIHLSTEKQ